MLSIIEKELDRILQNIKSGNCNLSENEQKELVDILLTINSTKLSKDQAANYLNYSVSNFNKMLYLDKIPKGRKQRGFKELFWLKYDLDKHTKAINNKCN